MAFEQTIYSIKYDRYMRNDTSNPSHVPVILYFFIFRGAYDNIDKKKQQIIQFSQSILFLIKFKYGELIKVRNEILRFREHIWRKINFVIYGIIFVLAAVVFNVLLSIRITNSINAANEDLRLAGMTISSAAKSAVDHTMLLRDSAQISLSQPAPSVPNELFSSLTINPKEEKYELRVLPPNYKKDSASYILGGGKIPVHSSETAQEIEASLKLNPLFADIKYNIPQATWVYYYSVNRFINMYPFESQADTFTWSDDYLVHPLFLRAKPEQNPGRNVQWFNAYIDEAGKGLMTSIIAPVYDEKNQFRAMVGMDFTLESMKSYISGTGLAIGNPLLVNKEGQVLAYTSGSNPDGKTVKQLNEVLPFELKDASGEILKLNANQYYDISGWKIYAIDIKYAPWRLLFLVNKKELAWNTIGKMWVELTGILLILFIIGIFEQRRRIAGKLRTFKAAVDSSSAAIVISDSNRLIQYTNKSFTEITGYSKAEVIGRSTSVLESGLTPQEAYTGLRDSLIANKSWKGELLSRKKDGTMYWVNVSLSPVIRNKDDGCFVAVIEDITERKQMIEELSKLATIDVLTDVANRGFFLSIAEREFRRANRYNRSLSVMMLDIDHFKQINDTYGHITGDLVLQRFSSRCCELIRNGDCMGRLGGEEFAFLLPEIGQEGALKMGERIRQAIESLETVTPDGSIVKITCSIGVAQMEKDDDTFDVLLSRADKALYEAKYNGRNRVMAVSMII